jgi:hypothetical protein
MAYELLYLKEPSENRGERQVLMDRSFICNSKIIREDPNA